jgi:isopentenyldiphosphate isomerase
MTSEPADELVDVCDEEGRVVGRATRREMRERRLPHRVAYVLVFDRDGRLFVHLRTATKDVYPSHWDVAIGGVLAAGEDFDTGATRELAEELGVTAPLQRLFPFRFEDARTVVHGVVYRAVHEGPFRFQPEEVVRGEFVDVDEVPGRAACEPFCPDGLAVLARFRRT